MHGPRPGQGPRAQRGGLPGPRRLPGSHAVARVPGPAGPNPTRQLSSLSTWAWRGPVQMQGIGSCMYTIIYYLLFACIMVYHIVLYYIMLNPCAYSDIHLQVSDNLRIPHTYLLQSRFTLKQFLKSHHKELYKTSLPIVLKNIIWFWHYRNGFT